MSMEAISAAFDAARNELPGGLAAGQLRERAMAAFREQGLPDRRMENWKYTDIKSLASRPLNLLPACPVAADISKLHELVAPLCPDGVTRMVFVDGHHIAQASSPFASNGALRVSSLRDEWENLQRTHAPRNRLDEHPLALLNTALAQDGAWIEATADQTNFAPVHLVFVSSGTTDLSPQPRIVIDLGANVSLQVVIRFVDMGDADGWINAVTQIRQASGSSLDLLRIQDHGPARNHTGLTVADLHTDATLRYGCVDLGGRLIRNDTEIRLLDAGANTDLYGLFFTADGQHVDNHTRVDHIAPQTLSSEVFRGIAATGGRGVFNGKVVVHPGAARIEARQSSDNLLLGERAEIDTKPELEIYSDDVKCTHGATVGELDEEHLYYLRARGIGESDARSMLTSAFANVVINEVRDSTLRDQLGSRVREQLAQYTGVNA